MENIHIIPTDKPSRLYVYENKLFNYHKPQEGDRIKIINQNIYITSDEKIKNDEYYLGEDNNIYCLVTSVNCNGKKIILTTDLDLIKDEVESIDNNFLEWFIKNPSCEEIKIEEGKLIIPKEESKTYTKEGYLSDKFPKSTQEKISYVEFKQEILEENAKFQKEQDEEQLIEFANWCRIQDNKFPNRIITTQQLFEQFKDLK